MYKALCLFFIDKFGKDEFNKNVRTILFKWSYFLRITKQRVFLSSIDKYIKDPKTVLKESNVVQEFSNAFEKINNEYLPYIAMKNMDVPYDKDNIQYNIKEVEEIFNNK
jgi:hypothetical protein